MDTECFQAMTRHLIDADSIIANKQSRSAPAWVYANGGTSMRLVQTGRTPVSSSHAGSSCGVHSPHASSHADFDAAFQQAPWMGHGGVRNMEAGHTGHCPVIA